MVLSVEHIDGLVQDCSNSSALAMELLQSCTKPSVWNQSVRTIVWRAMIYTNHMIMLKKYTASLLIMYIWMFVLHNAIYIWMIMQKYFQWNNINLRMNLDIADQ